ncbi:hypothetical protein BOW65_13400 [Pseudomonas koreensis]|uniref:hypothetical protein n=1 Tax=Pseudomonas koreensis TaxID=198620 RepID=UPI000986A976|nr:hypothetical protein [Pseudomonas koreensis]OOH79967.1 hypothetical protein BOW65_13400 [Pseudomonas koreensis]TKJ86780.1 hypothetical protein PkoCFBP13504_04915 [Pseudomonas koreensis]
MNKRLIGLIEFAISWIEASLSIKLYSLGLACGIAMVIHALTDPQRLLTSTVNHALTGVVMTLSGLGMLLEIHAWASRIKTWQESSWALRGVLAGLLTMSLAFSAAYASTIVNEVTEAPPSLFPYTVAFLTPLSALAILLIVLMVVYVAVMSHAFLAGIYSSLKSVITIVVPGLKSKPARWVQMVILMRALGIAALVLGCFHIQPWYGSGLKSVGWIFASRFEMYAHDPCIKPGAEEHIIRRDDDSVLVFSKHQPFMTPFERRRCAKDYGLPPASAVPK